MLDDMLYVLEKRNPKPEPDVVKWGEWYETADRQVCLDKVGETTVSTVFLGMNHAYFAGPPAV